MKYFNDSKWQYYLPQHLLSRVVGWVANAANVWLKNTFIDWFIKRYHVDLTEAEITDPHAYTSFNHFFTRALRAGVRPVDASSQALIAPADGSLSEFGRIQAGQLLQAKSRHYSLTELLAGDDAMVEAFDAGHYCTIYLAPCDYHRVHLPFEGQLLSMVHVPGQLFSVNNQTAADIPNLFARNERVICYFETRFGKMAVILVGAMIVASIATVWHGQVTPLSRRIQRWNYVPSAMPAMAKGAELGRFYLGSTAIILTPRDAVDFAAELVVGQALRMGQAIGTVV